MIGCFPIPGLSNSVAFVTAWVVIDLRTALKVLALSVVFNVFFWQVIGSELVIGYSLVTHVLSVTSQVQSYCNLHPSSCTTEANTSFKPIQTQLANLFRQEEVAIFVMIPFVSLIVVRMWLTARALRKRILGIRKFYWGPDSNA